MKMEGSERTFHITLNKVNVGIILNNSCKIEEYFVSKKRLDPEEGHFLIIEPVYAIEIHVVKG